MPRPLSEMPLAWNIAGPSSGNKSQPLVRRSMIAAYTVQLVITKTDRGEKKDINATVTQLEEDRDRIALETFAQGIVTYDSLVAESPGGIYPLPPIGGELCGFDGNSSAIWGMPRARVRCEKRRFLD